MCTNTTNHLIYPVWGGYTFSIKNACGILVLISQAVIYYNAQVHALCSDQNQMMANQSRPNAP